MSVEYYCPTPYARNEVSKLLNLPDTGKEQDWEIEFACPDRVKEMLDLCGSIEAQDDVLTALFLLILTSLNEFEGEESERDVFVERAFRLLSSNKQLREKMDFYWVNLGMLHEGDVIARLFQDSQENIWDRRRLEKNSDPPD